MSMEKTGEELEERVALSMLYDFYGALLKESRRRMFAASVLEDYSFSEIAEQEGISRQGAYDAIKRATRQLREYEEKLGLVARFEHQKEMVKRLREELRRQQIPPEQEASWKKIYKLLEEILDEM